MRKFLLAVSLLLAGCATVPDRPAAFAPIDDAEMRGLIASLASDDFEGRMVGTAGEDKTIAFLAERLKLAGVSGGVAGGGYAMRFDIAERERPLPAEGPGMPNGQIAFMKAMNAAGAISSRNVVGVVRGRHSDGKAVVVMAHWDHFGICRPTDPVDRICNGAIDNASGSAAVLAVAARVARMRLDRDVWFVLTGAEEWGLLGAKAFVENPPIPLSSIVAGFNLDTIAIAPKGMPVAMVAAPKTGLEPLVKAAAQALGRKWDGDDEAAGFLRRQDGWAFAEKDVPMVMAGGSFSDLKLLQAFLGKAYHGVDDELTDATDLGGAVDDANLHVEMVRRAASREFEPRR
ncbi:MAG: M28 family peptidase [Sphingomicrobium sp.]